MVVKGLNPHRSYEYVPESERENKTDPAVFFLKVLPPHIAAELEDKTMAAMPDAKTGQVTQASLELALGTTTLKALRHGLDGWNENFKYQDGDDWMTVPVKKNDDGTLSDDAIAAIPIGLREELADVIQGMNLVDKEDVKN